jgi:predicted amidohydrolase
MRTIEQWIGSLGRRYQDPFSCPLWPPDLFAIAAALLKLSGAYINVFKGLSRAHTTFSDAHASGKLWRSKIDAPLIKAAKSTRRKNKRREISPTQLEKLIPRDIRRLWREMLAKRAQPIGEIKHDSALSLTLICMVISADEACAGIGIDKDLDPFLTTAQEILDSNNLQSFTWDVPEDTLGVLAKQRTPQRGATLRSLTHHLCLYLPNDIEARWVGPYGSVAHDPKNDTINFLLVPWPLEMDGDEFKLAETPHSKGKYFEYSPRRDNSARVGRWLRAALQQAKRQARCVDVVVLPELALSISEYRTVERICVENRAMLICGLRLKGSKASRGANLCAIQPAGLYLRAKGADSRVSKKLESAIIEVHRLMQAKHHRWRLDRDQILQYQLAGNIQPEGYIWENIEIEARILHFVTFTEWMTWSVLVCEDLAQQDPAADLLRAVGPNLLVTLLMDGPQLRDRWSSRYASVFADDPGSSVLTLTSLGMSDRSRPTMAATGRRADKVRSIALWKDVVSGEREIVLDSEDDACVLTVSPTNLEEFSADGRGDKAVSGYLVFAGYKSFKVGI